MPLVRCGSLVLIYFILNTSLWATDITCNPRVSEFVNKDKSEVKLSMLDCDPEVARLKLEIRKSGEKNWTTGLEYQFENFIPPYNDAELIDVNNDGFVDLKVIESCGNVNCWSKVYLFDSDKYTFYHFYSGQSIYEIEDGMLISQGRVNCCSWEYDIYSIPKNGMPINELTDKIAITVYAPEKNGTGKSKCTFTKFVNGEERQMEVPDKKFLKYCKHYIVP